MSAYSFSPPTLMTSSIPTSLALTNSAYSLPTYSSGVANQNDSFNQASKKPTPVEAKKGKLPSWLAWAVEFIVPTVVIMSFHRLPLRQFSAKTRILLSCSVAGVSTGAIDYWRQKNNDGKVSWPNWMLNTALASTPFELLLGRRK